MDIQKLEAAVKAISVKRDAARAKAAAHPSSTKIEALTVDAVAYANRGKDAGAMFAERDALKDARDADVRALGEELSQARRDLRWARTRELVATLEKQTVEQLEAQRAQLTDRRKAIKIELRAVSAALAKRTAAKVMADLWKNLSAEERAALLASAAEK
jgi:hypothetical protein